MPAYYETILACPFDPERAAIYTLKSGKKKNFYVRIKRREGKGYFTKSLKTESVDIALERAKKHYHRMWQAETQGLVFRDEFFCPMFERFLNAQTSGVYRKTRLEAVYRRYFSVYFKGKRIQEIKGRDWDEYVVWRKGYWKRASDEERKKYHQHVLTPSATTLKSERGVLIQAMNYWKSVGVLKEVPTLSFHFNLETGSGVVSQERETAKGLSQTMEKKINGKLYQWCVKKNVVGKGITKRHQWGRWRLYYWVKFSRHTLVRPTTEMTHMLWKDIEIVPFKRGEGKSLAVITVTKAKSNFSSVRKERIAVMPFATLRYLKEWREIELAQGRGRPMDYVFPSESGGMALSRNIGHRLHKKLKEWGLDKDEYGRRVTMYSLTRSTGISRRIRESGWSIADVAEAAGSSLRTISSYYHADLMRAEAEKFGNVFRNGTGMVPASKKQKWNEIGEETSALWQRLAEIDDDIDPGAP